MLDCYRDDLAYIHDAAFGGFPESAASVVVEALSSDGLTEGIVVNLGCGSGIAARLLVDAGYGVVGIDISESMIEMARQRVPEGDFRRESFVTAEIPPCVAVTAIGEVLNYTFDPANGEKSRLALFKKIRALLAPDGVFLFDMAGPSRAPWINPEQSFFEGSDWTIMVEAEADDRKSLLTRRITTFRRVGKLYRRRFEIHHLQLVEPEAVLRSLGKVGFTAEILDSYESKELPEGITGFLCRKRG